MFIRSCNYDYYAFLTLLQPHERLQTVGSKIILKKGAGLLHTGAPRTERGPGLSSNFTDLRFCEL